MGLSLTTAPDLEPLTLDEAKTHLRVDAGDTSQDALISALIQAARESVESFTRRALVTQTWTMTLDRFPVRSAMVPSTSGASVYATTSGQASGITGAVIRLPYPPLQSVTSITYVDANGATQTLATAEYVVQTDTLPGQIALAYGKYWPTTRSQENAVTITYVAGYGAPSSVPARLRAAMLLILADLYERREATITGTIVAENPAVQSLLWSARFVEVP